MTPQEFLDEFGTLAESAEGVPKLRELILELAFGGKLVLQDPNDEPAISDVEEIEEEKSAIVEARKLRLRNVTEIAQTKAMKYEIPDSWRWFRFGDVVFFQEGPGIRNWQFTKEGVKLLNVQNIVGEKLVLGNTDRHVAREEYDEKYTHFAVETGDILFASSGGSWGKAAWFEDPGYTVMLNTSMIRLKFYSAACDDNFLFRFLQTDFFRKQMSVQLVGMQPNFGSTHLSRIYIPLPPLAEQHRIVSKVDELMGLCDRLEAVQGERRGVRVRLNRSSLDRLTSVSGVGARQLGSELSAAWQRVCDHFEVLYDTPETLPDLRQTILQLAVQGKLVPQDPNDEPAEELLSRIVETRKNANGKKKRVSTPREFDAAEVEFNLPASWRWCQVEDIATVMLGGTPARGTSEFWNGSVEWVSSGEVANCRIADTKEKITQAGLEGSNAKIYPAGTVLIAMIGQGKTRGQSAILDIDACTNQNVAGLVFDSGNVDSEYVWQWALCEYARTRSQGRGGAQPALNGAKVRALRFPLPPLSEQKRIVSKVTHLLSQVTRLESTLTRRESTRTQLLTAAIHGLMKIDRGHADR